MTITPNQGTSIKLVDLFPEYRPPTKAEFENLNKNAIIVFDTNVLLDLYRLPVEKAVDILTKMEKLKDRIWIPLQVVEEFNRRRRSVIEEQKRGYNNFIQAVSSWLGTEGEVSKDSTGKYKIEKDWILNKYRHPYLKIDKYISKVEKSFKKVIKDVENLQKQHPHREEEDQIFIKLNAFFEGRIGCGLTDEVLNGKQGVYGDGENGGNARYQLKIPPGFADAKEKDRNDPTKKRKFGDLIIWYEIIEQAKKEQKPVVFVTGDDKVEWWWEENNVKCGPHYMLRREFREKTNGMLFYAYRTDDFLSNAENFGVAKIDDEIVVEARKIIESNSAAYAAEAARDGVTGSFQKTTPVKANVVGSKQAPDTGSNTVDATEVGEAQN